MAFWTSQKLATRIPRDSIVDPYDRSKIDCAAFTLKLGGESYITGESDCRCSSNARGDAGELILIPSGQFGFLISEETVHIPLDAVGFISVKTKFKFRGLINASGFHVDPGYRGKLVFGVYNAGPKEITLKRGEDMFLLFLSDLDSQSDEYYESSGFMNITSDIRNNIDGPVRTVDEMRSELEELKSKISLFQAIAATVALPLLWAVIKSLGG